MIANADQPMSTCERDLGDIGFRSLLAVAATCAGVVLGLATLSPLIPHVLGIVSYIIAFLSVTGMTIAAATVAPVPSWRALLLSVLSVIGVLFGVYLTSSQNLLPSYLGAVIVTGSLLVGGASLGGAVGGRVEHPGHLLTVVIVSLLVDSFSVFHAAGPTAAIVERPAVIALLALPFPVLGTDMITPVLGVGDVIFAALYMSASRRFGLGRLRTAIALTAGLILTMVGVILLQIPLPALIAMGIAFLFAHPCARRLPREDRRKAICILAILVILWLFLFLRG